MAKDQEHASMARVGGRRSSYGKDAGVPMTEREWSDYTHRQIQKNYRSGMTAFDDATNAGYFLGWHEGSPAFAVGDRSIDKFLEYTLSGLKIGSATTISYGDTPVSLAFGIQSGEASDGDVITFNPEFATVPKVIFGQGGLSYDSTLGSAADQTARVQPVGLTTTGFTLKAKIADLGTLTAQSFSFSATTVGVEYLATKASSTEAYDDNYIVNYVANVEEAPDPVTYSSVTVKIFTKPSGGSFTVAHEETFYNSNTGAPKAYNRAKTVTVSGLGANAEIKVERTSTSGDGGTVTASDVDYDTSTVTERSKTPTGATKIPWMAIATS